MKLDRLQLEDLISHTHLSEDGRDLYGICPWCGQDEFGISLVQDNHPYNCFRKKACGESGNIYTLLKYLGKVKEVLGDREIDVEGQLGSLTPEIVEEESMEPLPTIEPPILWRRVFEDEYLTERGFTDEQFHKFQVGRSRLQRDYVTFLIEMNHVVTGYISRSVKSKEWIDAYNEEAKKINGRSYLRYKNSTSDFSRMLFGYDEIIRGKTTDVILVEGIFSKTKTDVNLDLDCGKTWIRCVATFGAKISDHQIRLLKDKGVKRVWLWFEADVLGKVKSVAAKLSLLFDSHVSYIKGLDPGDISQEEAIALLENSMSYVDINQNYL